MFLLSKLKIFIQSMFGDDNTDRVCYERNVVFKTPEEAVEVAKKMLAMLTKESEN